jgi:SAM-dependent methyltransferase
MGLLERDGGLSASEKGWPGSLQQDYEINAMSECEEVRQRYDRRISQNLGNLYSPLLPDNYLSRQEKERAVIRWINTYGIAPVENKLVLEIGCGTGGNLLDLLRLGFMPENLVGNELLEERVYEARKRLPADIRIIPGDARNIDFSEGPFDIVSQSTVFTSLLDKNFQYELAGRMWELTKAGGGVLWYDFVYDNPNNPDVRGINVRTIRKLFPEGQLHYWRLTLAPPLSRLFTGIHPLFYPILNTFPFLRTHALCWIKK